MKPQWYADKRDLVKWSVLYHIAAGIKSDIVLQVAFFRKSKFGKVIIDGKGKEIPQSVLSHFRNLSNICNMDFICKIDLFDEPFGNRQAYLEAVLKRIGGYKGKKKIIFLDTDTGLEPQRTKSRLEHVLEGEVRKIWEAMEPKDVLALYQHKTNMASKPWIDEKKNQLEGVVKEAVKIAHGPGIVNDVAFLYLQK